MAAMILLTGASGYIGSRLLRVLEEGGCAVRCLARRRSPRAGTTEVVRELRRSVARRGHGGWIRLLPGALDGERTRLRRARSQAAPTSAAPPPGPACAASSISEDSATTRIPVDTSEEPRRNGRGAARSGVPVVEFRASIVIGAGSLSFEMIRALVERLPVMICPDGSTPARSRSRSTTCWRIWGGARPAEGARRVRNRRARGGLLRRHDARVRARAAGLLHLDRCSRRGCRGCGSPGHAGPGARRARAGGRPAQSHGRALAAARETFEIRRCRCARPSCARSKRRRPAQDRHAPGCRRRAARAGVRAHPAHRRRTGWYFGDALWRLRGWLDGCLGGAGMPRHRRDPDACAVGDVIDGWRVEAYEPDRLLRLAAGLKLPGRGWLEFRVDAARRRSAIADPPDGDIRPETASRADSIGTACCRSTRSSSAACCGGSRGVPYRTPRPRICRRSRIARSSARQRPRCSAGTSSRQRSRR